jgi:hypothetical protein
MTFYYKINPDRVLKTKMGENRYYQVKVYGNEYKKKDLLIHEKHLNKQIYEFSDAIEYGDKYIKDLNNINKISSL